VVAVEVEALVEDPGAFRLFDGSCRDAAAQFSEERRGTLNPLTITDANIDDIVEFLKALTDERVQCDQAPFDHPELVIPVGHKPVDQNRDDRADDIVFRLPEVGASGYSPGSGLCVPNAGDLFAPGMQARIGGPPAPAP
jgi:hypothetical protein